MNEALLQELLDAGCPPMLVVKVSAEMARLAEQAASLERRRASDRERSQRRRDAEHNVNHVSSRDVADAADATPSLDKEKSPRPPKEINPNPERGLRAQGVRLPAGWKPGKFDRSTVSGQIVEARGQEWARCALESFENHWRSANGPNARKRDWQATWANWVIEQDRRDGKGNFNGKRPANDHRTEPQNAMFRVGLAEFGTG